MLSRNSRAGAIHFKNTLPCEKKRSVGYLVKVTISNSKTLKTDPYIELIYDNVSSIISDEVFLNILNNNISIQ